MDKSDSIKELAKVYEAISNVQGELAKQGIAKDKKNKAQGYQFRGIDELYNALSGHLADAKLCIIPRVLSREITTRKTSKGADWYNVVVDVEFDFVSGEDGSMHTAKSYGEAMDSADKATNKAMTAAYKYMCFMVFAIPTEGEDADAHTPPDTTPEKPKKEPKPSRREAERAKELVGLIGMIQSESDGEGWRATYKDEINAMHITNKTTVTTAYKAWIEGLKEAK